MASNGTLIIPTYSKMFLSEVYSNNDLQSHTGQCSSSISSTQGGSGYYFSFVPIVKGRYTFSLSNLINYDAVVSYYQGCAYVTCILLSSSQLDLSLDSYGPPYSFFLVNRENSYPAFSGDTTVQISYNPVTPNPTVMPAVFTVNTPVLQPEILAMVIIYPIFTVLIIVGTILLYVSIVAKRSDPLNNVMLADLDNCTRTVPKIEKLKRLCVTAIALTLLLWMTVWGIYLEAVAYLLTIPMFIMTCLVLELLVHHERHFTSNSNVFRGRDGVGIALIVLSSFLIVNLAGFIIYFFIHLPPYPCPSGTFFLCYDIQLSYFILGCVGATISLVLAGISIDIGVTVRIIKFNDQATSNLPIAIASPMSSPPITTVEFVSMQPAHTSVKHKNQITNAQPHWEQMAYLQTNQGV